MGSNMTLQQAGVRPCLIRPHAPRSVQISHRRWGGVPTPQLTVFAGLAVEARATTAGARGGLTGAVVVARALQAAGGSVAPSGTGCREPAGRSLPPKRRGHEGQPLRPWPHSGHPGALQPTRTLTQLTVRPRPAQATGAAAIGSVAQATVLAGAGMLTAHAKPVLGAAWGQKSGAAGAWAQGRTCARSDKHSLGPLRASLCPLGTHVPGSNTNQIRPIHPPLRTPRPGLTQGRE